jgi:hypothetical protein
MNTVQGAQPAAPLFLMDDGSSAIAVIELGMLFAL